MYIYLLYIFNMYIYQLYGYSCLSLYHVYIRHTSCNDILPMHKLFLVFFKLNFNAKYIVIESTIDTGDIVTYLTLYLRICTIYKIITIMIF